MRYRTEVWQTEWSLKCWTLSILVDWHQLSHTSTAERMIRWQSSENSERLTLDLPSKNRNELQCAEHIICYTIISIIIYIFCEALQLKSDVSADHFWLLQFPLTCRVDVNPLTRRYELWSQPDCQSQTNVVSFLVTNSGWKLTVYTTTGELLCFPKTSMKKNLQCTIWQDTFLNNVRICRPTESISTLTRLHWALCRALYGCQYNRTDSNQCR